MAPPQSMSLSLTPPLATAPARRPAPVQSVPKRLLDPPAAWNPTVALFLGGYLLAGLSLYGWFAAGPCPSCGCAASSPSIWRAP